jgi:hypothetical protein
VSHGSLVSGNTRSCGCLRSETSSERNKRLFAKHGHRLSCNTSSTYHSWTSMIKRCTNPNHVAWSYYNSKGIGVCDRWVKFENFLADMGEKPVEGWHLHRLNGNGNYEPGNCIWISPSGHAQIHSNEQWARAIAETDQAGLRPPNN